MIKRLYILVIVQMVCTLGFTQSPPSLPAYKDPSFSIDVRLSDLLSRMTLEEKVGQLLCPLGWEMYEIHGNEVCPSGKFKQLIKERNVGMLWATYRADPWTKKTLANGLNPEMAAKAGNALQKYVMENTRLGIPMFLAEEAPHGHMAIGATVFPTGIGMAATWSPELVKEVGQVIAKEIRSQGGHISYGPVLDLTRDPRWSRVEETFGEDPVLSGTLGASMVDGLGGGNLSQKYATIATLKHFLAYAVPEGGQNGNYASVGIRDLHQNFLPPFRKAIDAGALSVMTSYNSIDGIPCTSNHYLLTQLLRNEWKFRGFVVSDLYSIEGIHESHFVAPTKENAAIQSVMAGVDVDLGGDAYTNLCHAVQSGQMDKAVIDTAVCRVLRMKFEMGLFEHPYVDPKIAAKTVRRKEHIELARKIAQSSITLLKNENSILPLSKMINKVAVIGPNADNRYNMLGDYTAPQEDSNVKTVLDGIITKLSPSRVEYVRGCAIRDTTVNEIEQAIEAARRSEVVIVVVGGSSARDFKTSYKETGAAVAEEGSVSDMECGEGFDRASLSLLGRQQELLESLQKTGKPLIVVYIEGRPLEKNWASELCLSYGFSYSHSFNNPTNLTTKMQNFEMDSFTTHNGKSLKITFFKHASLLLDYAGQKIFIDPVSDYADYTQQPKADFILITHEHGDHFDTKAIAAIETSGTRIIANPNCRKMLNRGQEMKNGDVLQLADDMKLEAVPAYNTTPGRDKFHPKGRDNGYILTLGGTRIYIAGDTEDIPELNQVKDIDIAFLPVNQPYTMTPEQAIRATQIIKPHILYPYHYGDTDINKVKEGLKNEKTTEVRIRALQ